MRVLVAPDSFKGTLTAADVAQHLRRGLESDPQVTCTLLPLADGGDGTVDTLVASGFTPHAVPGGHPGARIAVRETTAAVEVANTCGLALRGCDLAPLTASSRPFGDAVRYALDSGVRRLVLGLGGSASTDGGMGLLTALGARFTDAGGRDLHGSGADLLQVLEVDLSRLVDLTGVELVLASDVDNPLLGGSGAAAVYAPQKGANATEVARLDSGLRRFVEVMTDALGGRVRELAAAPGAGAAGGLGFAGLLLGARLVSGADLVLDLAGFDPSVAAADAVITGEGRLDAQSLHGKLPMVVARRSAGRPVHAVVGSNDLDGASSPFASVTALIDTHGPACATDPGLSGVALTQAGRVLATTLLRATSSR